MSVLFLTHRLPYAPNRGDRIRAFHLLHALAKANDVHLVSLVHDDEEAAHAVDLQGVAASVTIARVPAWRNRVRAAMRLATATPLTHLLLDAPDLRRQLERLVRTHPPNVVLSFCSGMANLALEQPLAAFPLVLDMVDVDSEKWSALATAAAPPMSWIYAREQRCLSAFERVASTAARATLVTTPREAAALGAIAPDARVHVVPNGIDVEWFRPQAAPAGDPVVVFCGVMSYQPNRDAALWLAREVWPIVKARRPDAKLTIVGADPDAAVRRLQVDDRSIEVTGRVPDVRPFLWRAACAVAPLKVARGVQNKVLEAVAAGLPCVVTPIVASGLPDAMSPALRVADTPEACADAVSAWLEMAADERRAIAARADLSGLSWADRLRDAVALVRDAGTAR